LKINHINSIFKINSRGESNLLWYFWYLTALVIILGTMTYLGVNTFTVHTNTGVLSHELIAEYTYDAVYTTNPLTGRHDQLRTNMANRLAELDQTEDHYAARVKIGNSTYYSDEPRFGILLSTVGTATRLKRIVRRVNNQSIDISMVIEG
jgi:hypothetical protein